MTKNFTHLHLHTDGSLKDGLGTVNRMVQRAKSIGFGTLAMTDHGTLSNAVVFSNECARAGIKPVFGLEGYIYYDNEIGHITLLADGERGWHSLLKLSNLAHASEYKSPAFTVDQLIAHQAGLVCLTGCISSPLQQLGRSDAIRLAVRLKEAFGARLFAEVMTVSDSDTWSRSFDIAERLSLKPVLTNDVHFPYEEDGAVHPILVRMKSGFTYDSSNLWLKSGDELFKHAVRKGIRPDLVTEMMNRASAIGDKIGKVNLAKEPSLPYFPDADDWLVTTTTAGLARKIALGEIHDDHWLIEQYKERVRHELSVIMRMDYASYFVILKDIVDNARSDGVKVGPGRGSGAGSLVLWLLGITSIDPIKNGLQFERFLNPERRGMPDVDVDFDSEKRELVLDYAANEFGAMPIATFSRYSHKSLVHDLAKAFRIPRDLEKLSADNGPESADFQLIKESYPGFERAYEALIGQIRHKGKHAGGVIITDVPVPVERTGKELAASWTEGQYNELSYAGIVKFDLLGLSVLSALRRLEAKHGEKPSDPYIGHSIVYEKIFQTGDLSGIFQFSGSSGIRDLTMKLKPNKFEDLVAINALYRPGALDAGTVDKYPDWKKKPRRMPKYIEDVTEETYGVIVYQEQFMEIYRRTVDGSLGEADLARRVITKSKPDDPKWVEKFENARDRFLNGATKHGLTPTGAEKLWKELATHARYSFNKSHSTAYSQLAWECAWWKCFYPASFFAEMLNTDRAQEQTYIFDAVRSGIEIIPVDINRSTSEYISGEDRIYLPLSTTKYLGDAGVDAILKARASGPFLSLENFMDRVPKKYVRAQARVGLFKIGAFNGILSTPGEKSYAELLDVKEIPTIGFIETQLKYLGFVIPGKSMLAEFDKYESMGRMVGIIEKREMRKSTYGPYCVYKLSPTGTFWTRDAMDLKTGEVVAVDVSEKNGKAKIINIIKGKV